MNYTKSIALFEEAKKYIPGGVNSPVRAFKSVGGTPLFIERGEGSRIFDADKNEYIEYVGSWGPHLFGHNPKFIIDALKSALENGTSFGAPTELEIKMAKIITELVPSIEKIRMVNSGTEATMSAIRAARGFTNRNKFIKFEGCYHGHADYFLIKAGSGALTFGVPTSPGVTAANAADTLVADYNYINSVKTLIHENKNEIAAIIIEPIAGNMGVVPASKEFLAELRDICTEEEIVLIFDEVMSGFRVAKGGAQEVYGIKPDMTTFGKIIGGGLPVGAFGGRKDIMDTLAPVGPVYQAGTLSGNPLAMSAGIAALTHIKENKNLYNILEEKSQYLEDGIKENMKKFNKSFAMNRVGSMSCLFFTDKKVDNFPSALTSDAPLYGKYFHKMLENGVYLAPSQFEAMFISTAHSKEDLDKTIEANYLSLRELL
ncbi:MAG: glutamate-1-semialdehyde-2,1-aminomutase [Ignavibacteriales bacterium CG18_big_fil_WC_8_21_14_2_50_31_20]|nr:MAG: glutamate-1-semialdehyde-2,1-aminomutase [Ignavibacteriales bacterium CG18_big_fil_WC_8_21_14_2_50_31_20]